MTNQKPRHTPRPMPNFRTFDGSKINENAENWICETCHEATTSQSGPAKHINSREK